ncbi:TatD family hydrolase [Candidatus Daviesbacteria bacterium]|nr:TatD family hydrolase [Candidatus Daviesbacteria bacterium]
MLTDTHAHLYWDSFKQDFASVIQNSLDVGVTTIINVGVDVEKSKQALELDSGQAKMTFYSTVGIHPHEAIKFAANPNVLIPAEIKKLEDVYYQNIKKIVAIGECGLDFAFDNNPDFQLSKLNSDQTRRLQVQLFKEQIGLARKLNLPLVIHCRDERSQDPWNIDAWNHILPMVANSRGILHCYSGTAEITKKALDLDFLISFAGTLTYPKNEYLREAAENIPLNRICIETDCPFLPPQSKRGQRNEPSNVLEVAKTIAEIKGISLEEVANKTTENVKRLFNLKI